MENIEGLSKEEIESLIREQLREVDIIPESFEIEVVEGPQVILRGKIDSRGERAMVMQIIIDVVGIDDIVDELVVVRDENTEESEEFFEDADVRNPEEGDIGTEDAFQSIEDGIPYIPPTRHSYQEFPETKRKKKSRKKKKEE